MSSQMELRFELFGEFNDVEIEAIIDHNGTYWFTQDVIAEALEIDRMTISHMLKNHRRCSSIWKTTHRWWFGDANEMCFQRRVF